MTNEQKAQNAARKLEMYIRNYRIFVDTCIFLHSDYEKLMKNAEPYLRRYNARIIVPMRVLEEMERVGQRKPELRRTAQKARNRIAEYTSTGLVRVMGDSSDSSQGDNLFLSLFTKFRLKHNLLLLTNDQELAASVESLGSCSCVNNIKHIKAQRISGYGFLQPVLRSTSNPAERKSNADSQSRPFALGHTEVVGKGELLPVSQTVQEGSWLTARNGQGLRRVQLSRYISSGGEGTIYSLDGSTSVAKIYQPEHNTTLKRDKLQLMLCHKVYRSGVCFPTALLYNDNDEFVGYMMPKAQGVPLQLLLYNRAYLQQHFPNWKKKDTVQLCITILKLLSYLHGQNIVLGDINPNNILVKSPEKVYMVDTDSYQVENYPCPVGTSLFTAPEIQGRNFAYFLRSEGNERFSVATLLFLIMMMGKSPYAKQDGGDLVDNIRNGDFSYALGEMSNGQTPSGDWRFIWSHLSRPVKEAFYHTFHRDGKFRAEGNRMTDHDWLSLFTRYLHGLEHGMVDRDPMSGELFPTRLKRSDLVNQKVCRSCGKSVPYYEICEGLCYECRQSNICDTPRPAPVQQIYNAPVLDLPQVSPQHVTQQKSAFHWFLNTVRTLVK